jgi:hypothetical protein
LAPPSTALPLPESRNLNPTLTLTRTSPPGFPAGSSLQRCGRYDDATLTVTAKGVAYRIFEWLDLEISVDKSQPHRPALALKILGTVEPTAAPVSKRARKK